MISFVSKSPQKRRKPNSSTLCALGFSTDLGWMAIGIEESRLRWLRFGFPSWETLQRNCPVELARANHVTREQSRWVSALQKYAQGEPVELNRIPLTVDAQTEFQKATLMACYMIPRGQTLTYGELATRVGHPKAARAVGTVMKHNRLPILIPCHRVLGQHGLGGYSAPHGVAVKRKLLDLEGARIG